MPSFVPGSVKSDEHPNASRSVAEQQAKTRIDVCTDEEYFMGSFPMVPWVRRIPTQIRFEKEYGHARIANARCDCERDLQRVCSKGVRDRKMLAARQPTARS